jgi:hypothetical protein
MPQKQGKSEIKTQPSPSFIQKIMGEVMSDSLAKKWPELATQFHTHELSMPNETALTNRVFEMGPISKLLYPEAEAITGPFGTIGFNKDLIERNKSDLRKVMTHELTHIGQGKGAFLKKYSPGGLQELENEAVNREAMRNDWGDIPLRVTTAPDIMKKGPMKINLPIKKPRVHIIGG